MTEWPMANIVQNCSKDRGLRPVGFELALNSLKIDFAMYQIDKTTRVLKDAN